MHRFNSKYTKLIVSIVLYSFSWVLPGCGWMVFIALVPLFLFFDELFSKKNRFLKVLFIFFGYQFIIHLIISYWISDSSFASYMIGVFFESTAITLLFLPSFIFFRYIQNGFSPVFFIFNWILFEYVAQVSSLTTPFYILGSSLGEFPLLIQNYNLIGIEGGTLWILLTNMGIFFLFKGKYREYSSFHKNISLVISVALFTFSFLMGYVFEQKLEHHKIKVAALHTDIDQNDLQFRNNQSIMIDSLWSLSRNLDSNVSLLIWPESMLTDFGWTHEYEVNNYIQKLDSLIETRSELCLTFGASLYTLTDQKTEEGVNFSSIDNYYYYAHNVAYSVSKFRSRQVKVKKQFIPFQEYVPFSNRLPFLRKLSDFLIGEQIQFNSNMVDRSNHFLNRKIRFAPILCYETCFPLYVSELAKDAHFLTLHTNERWNRNDTGFRQYKNWLTGIAIQCNKSIAKSSNGGITCIVSENGETLVSLEGKMGCIVSEINLTEESSFYSMINGFTYIFSAFILSGFFIADFVKRKI